MAKHALASLRLICRMEMPAGQVMEDNMNAKNIKNILDASGIESGLRIASKGSVVRIDGTAAARHEARDILFGYGLNLTMFNEYDIWTK